MFFPGAYAPRLAKIRVRADLRKRQASTLNYGLWRRKRHGLGEPVGEVRQFGKVKRFDASSKAVQVEQGVFQIGAAQDVCCGVEGEVAQESNLIWAAGGKDSDVKQACNRQMTAEIPGDIHRVEVSHGQPGAFQQGENASSNRSAGELNLSNVFLSNVQRRGWGDSQFTLREKLTGFEQTGDQVDKP